MGQDDPAVERGGIGDHTHDRPVRRIASEAHLMRSLISSRIMRTTIDLDATVLRQLKQRSRRVGKSMGQLASELLARSFDDTDKSAGAPPTVVWIAKDLGRPLVDLEDREAVRAALDSGR
jgi:hypothetical protein